MIPAQEMAVARGDDPRDVLVVRLVRDQDHEGADRDGRSIAWLVYTLAAVGSGPSTGGMPPTVTLTLFETLPPEPVHVMLKLVVDVSSPERSLPVTGRSPLRPDVKLHAVAPVVLQLSVELSFLLDARGCGTERECRNGWTVTRTRR
jgi:hypothetical protein